MRGGKVIIIIITDYYQKENLSLDCLPQKSQEGSTLRGLFGEPLAGNAWSRKCGYPTVSLDLVTTEHRVISKHLRASSGGLAAAPSHGG